MAQIHSICNERKMLQLRNNKSARDNIVCDEDNNNAKSNLIIIDKPPAFLCQSNQYNSNESRRVIELSDQKTKMELRREFRLDEIQKINNGSAITSSYCSSLHKIINMSNTVYDEKILLPKLPAGTILIKQSNSCSNTKELSKNLMTQKVIEKTIESSSEKMKSVHGPEKIMYDNKLK